MSGEGCDFLFLNLLGLVFHFGCYFDFIEKIKNNLTPIVQKCYKKKKISDTHRALVPLP